MPSDLVKDIQLNDMSKIAVIGGGPSGSFFSYFAYDFAERLDVNISIDIYDAKNFCIAGAGGCNHCGGIVSESLVQTLSTDGIVLPADVIMRGINSYTLHLEQGSVVINTPKMEQRIASVFRGSGPQGNVDKSIKSFDNYLLDLCREKGANVILEKVTEMEKTNEGIKLKSKSNNDKVYDLVVGACGLNSKTLQMFNSICPEYDPPKTTRTYISEFKLNTDDIEKYLGNSMHVFLLNIPNITFGALIPKGNYVTLVLLGDEIDKSIAEEFTSSKEVRKCFPDDFVFSESTPCKCFPSININGAHHPYSDRMVLVGDSASSKLYKNGIGASYITGRSAAKTAIFQGISKNSFKAHYYPTCRQIDLDNIAGKFIFLVTKIIQKSNLLKKGLFQLVVKEQKRPPNKRRMSILLWDTFTGSAGYRDILWRFINPMILASFFGNIISSNLKTYKTS